MRDRIASSVVRDGNGCWIWQRSLGRNGYPQVIRIGTGQSPFDSPYRLSYEEFVGPIPEGLEPDHLCRVHACVNPDHLEPVTKLENWWRGVSVTRVNAVKTHCDHGHEFTEANTYIRPNGNRDCRACIRDRVRRYTARKVNA